MYNIREKIMLTVVILVLVAALLTVGSQVWKAISAKPSEVATTIQPGRLP